MNSSKLDIRPAESQKPCTLESEDVEILANRSAADQMSEEILEGFGQLAKQKVSPKAPHQAA